MLALFRGLIGDSLFAIRLVPALAGAAFVFVAGLLARELGGGRFAIALAALCSLVAPFVLAVSSIWSMNVFDLLFAALAALLLARLVNTGEPRLWMALGLVLGLGLANKVGVLWVGLGIFVGILATGERRWLRTPWPWLAASLAAACFLPYVIWNATHDWAHVEFIGRAVTGKYSGLTAWSFLSGQVLIQNPVTLPVWTFGLCWLLFAPSGRRYRILGILWITACAILLANGHSKAEAMAAVYHALPAEDRERAVLFAQNYGRAGALDYWADELDLPPVIGNHNNYWIWGPGKSRGEVVIVLGGDPDDLARRFASVDVAGRADCRWCIPYERDLPIYLCRESLLPIEELWPLTKHYD